MLPAGVEKALSFLALAVFGRVALKSRFEKQHVAGVQKLIMEGTRATASAIDRRWSDAA